MCFGKKKEKKKAQVPRKQSPMEAKNGSVQSLLNSPHSECDKYKSLASNFVSCGNGMVMVNMERYQSHELHVVISYNKNSCKKIPREIHAINLFMPKNIYMERSLAKTSQKSFSQKLTQKYFL